MIEGKYARLTGIFLASLAPALAWGTSSLVLGLACAAIVLASGCAAILAVSLTKGCKDSALPSFAALMTASAVSCGGELIMCAAFPDVFRSAPTLPLTGAALFFAACFACASASEKLSVSLCFSGAGAVLVILLSLLRLLLSFIPLAEDLSMGLILAGIVIAVLQLLLPDSRKTPDHETELIYPVGKALRTALALACAFLLTSAVFMTVRAFSQPPLPFLLCAVSAFGFSRLSLWIFTPETGNIFICPAAAVLALVQPAFSGLAEALLSSLGTAAAAVVLITALSPVLHRISLSDAPACFRGLPAALVISGITVLAFSGF